MSTECEPHTSVAQRALFWNLGACIRQRDRRTTTHQQFCCGNPASSGADHRHALAMHGESTLAGHLSFKVVRLNSAKMIAMMMNRVITLGSLQPMSSKW